MPVEEFKFSMDLDNPGPRKAKDEQVQELRLDDLDSDLPPGVGGERSSDLVVPEVAPGPAKKAAVPHEVQAQKIAQDTTIFRDGSASLSVFADVLSDAYGEEWLEWEPETIWTMVKRDFGMMPNDRAKEKIMALAFITKRDEAWTSWDIFLNVALAVNDQEANFHYMQYISPAEILRALKEMHSIRDVKVGEEVRGYIANICLNEGLVLLPDMLEVAQEYLDIMGNDTDLRDAVREKVQSIDMDNLDNIELDEDSIGIATARTIAILEAAKGT